MNATKTTGKVSFERTPNRISVIAIESGSELNEYRVLNATNDTIDAGLRARGWSRTTPWTYTTDGENIFGEAAIEISNN